MLCVNWCQFAVALANKVKIGLAFKKLEIYHGVYFDCIKIINLRGYIDLLDTSIIVFVNNLLWFVFHFIFIVELLVSSVICRFQGLSYSHVPECIEFSFILFIHHNIHLYFELCTYCSILDIYLSWNMNSVKYLFIWNYWIIYFVTCLEVFWSVMS